MAILELGIRGWYGLTWIDGNMKYQADFRRPIDIDKRFIESVIADFDRNIKMERSITRVPVLQGLYLIRLLEAQANPGPFRTHNDETVIDKEGRKFPRVLLKIGDLIEYGKSTRALCGAISKNGFRYGDKHRSLYEEDFDSYEKEIANLSRNIIPVKGMNADVVARHLTNYGFVVTYIDGGGNSIASRVAYVEPNRINTKTWGVKSILRLLSDN